MSNNDTKALFPFKTDKFWEEDDGKHNGWDVLSEFFNSGKGKDLAKKLKEGYNKETIFPAQKDIFRAFKLTPFEKVKVVILGQDPYPDERADGLCFSQKINSNKNDSLKWIFRVLKIKDENRQLAGWSKQGVLLLNAILTVKGGKAGSHKSIGWQEFTKRTINAILKNRDGEVGFILMGDEAIKLFNELLSNETKYIKNTLGCYALDYKKGKKCYEKNYELYNLSFDDNSPKIHVIESPHPSPITPLFKLFAERFKDSPFNIINNQFPNIAIKWEASL